MNLRNTLALCVLIAGLAAPATVEAQGPDPNNPYIQSISYGGSGCPQGTIGHSFANDRLSFTLIFDQFIAYQGPNVPAANKRRSSCRSIHR